MKNQPELRFRDKDGQPFPDWDAEPLGKLCKITTGRLDANAMDNDGKYPFFTCAKEVYKINEYAFDTEALLISGNGANVGYIHYYRGKFNAYQRTYVLNQFNENIFYIEQKLRKSLQARIQTEVKSGNTPYIVMGTLTDMKIALPPREEQQKIADFLGAVDKRIDGLRRKKELLEDYKKGLMQQIFSQKIRFKDDNGQPFPDWEYMPIGSIGSFYYGKSAPKSSVTEDAQTPCVRYGELYSTYNGRIKTIKSYTSTPESNLKFSRGGEVLVPRVGESREDFSKCSYLPHEGVAIGEMISVFNTKQNGMFYTYLFNTMKKQFGSKVEGGSVCNLYFRYLEPIVVPKPCIAEQLKIADFLESVDSKTELLDQKLKVAEAFKKGLLQKMFV